MKIVPTCTLLLFPLLISAPPSRAATSRISKELGQVAQKLIREYESKEKAPLAIFPLNSSQALARRGVGNAVSEMLTMHFVKSPLFTVVERTELHKILKEQKLQRVGAVDSDTAVRVGRIVGARILLLGSIEKLGGKYHVTARLVHSESGEVLAVSYGELSAGLFDEEARPFFAAVPKQQRIGFYFLYNFRHNNPAPTIQETQGTRTSTIVPESFSLGLLGGGIRYSPLERWMLDMSLAITTHNSRIAAGTNSSSNTGCPPPCTIVTRREITLSRLVLFRASTNYRHPVSSRWGAILGAGIASYGGEIASGSFDSKLAPFMRLGVECNPRFQDRLGFGLFLNYEFKTPSGSAVAERDSGKIPVIDATAVNGQRIFSLNKLSFEPTVAFYF